ncbi:MAG: hypothetical protein SFU98_16795 [Leptospiraceae bacterium]|nr:hypothetical protein [Leptospiraceae bacterium]
MDALFFMVAFLFVLFFFIQMVGNGIKSIFSVNSLNEVKLPNDMKVIREIKRVGIFGGLKAKVSITYNPKVKKDFFISGKDEEELEKNYKDLIAKFKLP